MEQEETMIVDGMIDFSSIEEQSIDICWTSAVEALRKIQQESLIIQDYNVSAWVVYMYVCMLFKMFMFFFQLIVLMLATTLVLFRAATNHRYIFWN